MIKEIACLNSLKIAVVIQEANKQLAKRLIILRLPVDVTLLHHVDRCDVVKKSEVVRAQLVEAGKDCRLDSVLQEVNCHEDKAVAGDCAVAGIIDVVKLSPKLHNQGQRTKAPIN